QEEVDTLMHLIGWAIERELPELLENNVRIRLIGDIDRIPDEARRRLLNAEEATSRCTGLTLGMCLSYSARWEIAEAARRLAARAVSGDIDPASISEKDVADSLATAGIPDPDLLIRTGGEERISNFLLWQIAYSELYFTPILWPDFGKEAYAEAIIDYQRRERRFGKTSAQVQNS
ncbi:MAG: di-trans,poly-cis-decaprenylcistransferase, partial [Muribaculaceae bacterium]|nr:di-trans,poly-cis-decaprenylcistransferase [Muribaculaceae bacterium]